MSKDWKKIARASDFPIPEPQLEQLAQSLDAMEASFRPLVRALPPETEPGTFFDPCVGDTE